MSGQSTQPVTPPTRAQARPDDIAPDGSEIRLLIGGSPERGSATRASLCEVTLPAGQVSRPVWHRTVEEIWYVLTGRGDVWRCPPEARPDEVPPLPVEPGDALVISTGWQFQFRAGPDAPLRFLCYTSPPWPGADEAQPAESGGLGSPTV